MRLFIAVDLDDDARRAIAAEQTRITSAIGDSRSSVRWVKPDRLHLTLVFLGEVSAEHASVIADAVRRPVDAAPFHMTLQGLGVFPSHGAPRAIWLGVTGGGTDLVELQREMARRVEIVGVAIDSSPFHPHLTLGRWRHPRPADRRQALAAAGPDVIARVGVSAVTLYQSRISSAGPTYTALARATLSGR